MCAVVQILEWIPFAFLLLCRIFSLNLLLSLFPTRHFLNTISKDFFIIIIILKPNLLNHHYLQQHPHLQHFHVATVFQVLIFPCLPIIMFRRWKMGEGNIWGIFIIIIIINNLFRRRPLPHIWLHTCSLHGGGKGLAQIQYQKTQIGVSNSATDSDKSLS